MNAIHILMPVIGAQLVVLASLLVATLAVQASRSSRRLARLRRLWTELLPAALANEPSAVVRIRFSLTSKAAWKAFHALVDDQIRSQHGSSPTSLRQFSRAIGLSQRLQRELLRARDPFDRAAAAKTLGRLGERIAHEPVARLLDSKDPAVVLAAAYATATFRDPEQFLPTFRAIYDRTPVTLHGAAELLSAFGKEACPTIHRLLAGVVTRYQTAHRFTPAGQIERQHEVDAGDAAAQVVMTDLLAFYAYRPAAATLLRLLSLSKDEEVLIHVVKAIAVVGDVSAVPRLTELLVHPNWVIRNQSVQALAALRATEVSAIALEAARSDEAVAVPA